MKCFLNAITFSNQSPEKTGYVTNLLISFSVTLVGSVGTQWYQMDSVFQVRVGQIKVLSWAQSATALALGHVVTHNALANWSATESFLLLAKG